MQATPCNAMPALQSISATSVSLFGRKRLAFIELTFHAPQLSSPRLLPSSTAGQQLVVHSWGGAKHAEALLGVQLTPRRWCHLAVAHSAGGALTQPLLRVYVDGALQVGGAPLALVVVMVCGGCGGGAVCKEARDRCALGRGSTLQRRSQGQAG